VPLNIEQNVEGKVDMVTGKPAKNLVIIARAY
jgi:hypothetical protein